MTAIRRRPLPAAAALLAICVCTVGAQSQPRGEYEIKAAYLYTFARFVEWRPQSSRDDSAFTICVLGTDPFGVAVNTKTYRIYVANNVGNSVSVLAD